MTTQGYRDHEGRTSNPHDSSVSPSPALGGSAPTGSGSKLSLSGFLAAVVGAALLAVVTIRALRVGFTHDESFSYLNFVSGYPLGEVLFHPFPSANDHYLNTLLMKFSSFLFGASEITLRIHSVLAYLVFLVSAYLIAREICAPTRVFLAFALLNLNPFLLEYFSLARGYATGLGLMMLSLLFLLRTLSASFRRPGFLALCLASAGLATLANFTFLNYYLALASVLLLLIAANRLPVFRAEGSAPSPQPLAANLLVLAGVTCALFAVVLPMIIRLKEAGEFYYGGDRGFFRDTVISLVQASRYNLILSQAVENSIGKLAVIIVLGALLISLGLCVRTRIESRSRALFCLAAITLVAALGTIAQNSLLGVKYPTDRTAILFVPLFVLAFISGIEAGARIWPRRPVQVAAFIILALADSAMAADCAHAFNFRFTAHWRYDADTREMLKDLAARHSFSASHSPIQLGVSWYLEPAINYYAATEKASWLEKVTRASVTEGEYDFYYVSEEDYRLLAKRNLTLLRRYDVSGNILLENRTNQN